MQQRKTLSNYYTSHELSSYILGAVPRFGSILSAAFCILVNNVLY